MMKVFEADQKRLKSILINYEEKKPDLTEKEKKDRLEIIQLLKESFLLFKIAYNDQTSKVEKSRNGFMDATMTNGDMTGRLDTSNINVSKINENNETVIAFMEEKVVRTDYLDFDGHINQITKKLERLEKEWLFGDFDNDEVFMGDDGQKYE